MKCIVKATFTCSENRPRAKGRLISTKVLNRVLVYLPPEKRDTYEFKCLVRKHAPKGGDWQLAGYEIVEVVTP